MKTIIKRISAVLVGLTTFSSLILASSAEIYTASGAFNQDFSDSTVINTVNRNNAWNSVVDLSEASIANVKRRNDAPNADSNGGKLKITSNGSAYSSSGETVSRTFIKFDKDFDISSTEKNLIVSYDVNVTAFNLSTEGEDIISYMIGGGLFQYTDEVSVSGGVFLDNTVTGNASNIGMALQIPAPQSGTAAEKAGLLIRTGNSFLMQENEGTFKAYSGGIFNRPIGNIYHVVYEVTPATDSASARVSKITISDSDYTMEFIVPNDNQYFNITGKTAVSGLSFNTWLGADYEIDNVKAHYMPEEMPAAEAVNSIDVSLNDSLYIKFNCYLNPETLNNIAVKSGDSVLDNAVIEYTESKTSYESSVAVTVPNMKYETTYTVLIPNTVISDMGFAVGGSELSYTTISLPNVTPQMTVSVNGGEITSISDAAGKYAVCNVCVTAEKNASAVLIVALYNSADEIISYGAQYTGFEAGRQENMTVSFPVPIDTQGMSIKAFACESLEKTNIILGDTSVLN